MPQHAEPRVQWVTRRFWPIVSDHVWQVLSLAGALQQQGAAVEIVTASWHNSWPSHVQLRELMVHRISPSPTTPFRSRRYSRELQDWLQNKTQSDTQPNHRVIVAEAGEEDALWLVENFSELAKIIVRYDCLDGLGPLSTRLRGRAVAACAKAHRVIVPHDYARRELIGAGVRPAQIAVVPDGPYSIVDRSLATRHQARRALADINHELFLRADDRAIVCFAELTKSAGVEFIIQALGPLLEETRGTRPWIIGDGPERLRLYELIKRQGWRHDISMPGTFEDPDLVLAAADLCIVPSTMQGCSWIMPTAIVSGLPTLISNSASLTARLGNSAQALNFETGNAARLQKLVTAWLHNPKVFQEALDQAVEVIKSRSLDVSAYLS